MSNMSGNLAYPNDQTEGIRKDVFRPPFRVSSHPLDVYRSCSVCAALEREVEQIRKQQVVDDFELRYAQQLLVDHRLEHNL